MLAKSGDPYLAVGIHSTAAHDVAWHGCQHGRDDQTPQAERSESWVTVIIRCTSNLSAFLQWLSKDGCYQWLSYSCTNSGLASTFRATFWDRLEKNYAGSSGCAIAPQHIHLCTGHKKHVRYSISDATTLRVHTVTTESCPFVTVVDLHYVANSEAQRE